VRVKAMAWPVAIVLVLVLTVAANAYLYWKASDPNGMAMEPDYYRKAVAWDSTRALERDSDALGWRLEARLAHAAGGQVEAWLTDAAGAPLIAAHVELDAIHNLSGGAFQHAALVERAPGVYLAALPLVHDGLWELRFDVRRAGRHFTRTLRRELAAR